MQDNIEPPDDAEVEARARALASQRIEDIERVAYARGKAAAELEATLKGLRAGWTQHETRLTQINGSIEKSGRESAQLREEVQKIGTEQRRRDAVNEALIAAGVASGAKKLARWQQMGIAVMALLAAGTLILALVQSLGHA